MLCAVYKSFRKSQTYIFVSKRDDFTDIPKTLLEMFGPPQLISMMNLKKGRQLARINADNIIHAIQTHGYYLQLPPPPIDHLKQHKEWIDLKGT
ncbi:YcgL domain-containing protein [Psychromonas sp. CD1]|uniref:YcgL domain-containing protein n=1 Tax=Psychromonas sp. CD1 TaxID=1979839 RepID=UPI000B9C0EB7|nr:YcgL domain-containing protein [Psychromonas sp. CD1]